MFNRKLKKRILTLEEQIKILQKELKELKEKVHPVIGKRFNV